MLTTTSFMIDASEKYLCIADQSVGFTFDEAKNQWSRAMFKTDSKYIIQPSEIEQIKWIVYSFSPKITIGYCESEFTAIGKLYCSLGSNTFLMNKNNNRFIFSKMDGYWNDGINDIIKETDRNNKNPLLDFETIEGNRTPYMEVGSCSTI